MASTDAIILAGGSGTRFGSETKEPKQFELLRGKPLFIHSLERLAKLKCFRQFVLVFPHPFRKKAEALVEQHLGNALPSYLVVGGGKRRQDSTWLGLEACGLHQSAPKRVIVHDACRPFLSPSFLKRLSQVLRDPSMAAWIPVVAAVDTMKELDAHGMVQCTVKRESLVRVQTPQVFDFTLLHSLVLRSREEDLAQVTDDASICETYGIPVGTFEGDPRNLKVTYPYDLQAVEAWIHAESRRELEDKKCESESDTTFTV